MSSEIEKARAILQATRHVQFQSTLMEMAKVAASISRIVDEAESKGLHKETLDRETDEQLQSLFRKQGRMFADFRGRGKQAPFGNGGRSDPSGLL